MAVVAEDLLSELHRGAVDSIRLLVTLEKLCLEPSHRMLRAMAATLSATVMTSCTEQKQDVQAARDALLSTVLEWGEQKGRFGHSVSDILFISFAKMFITSMDKLIQNLARKIDSQGIPASLAAVPVSAPSTLVYPLSRDTSTPALPMPPAFPVLPPTQSNASVQVQKTTSPTIKGEATGEKTGSLKNKKKKRTSNSTLPELVCKLCGETAYGQSALCHHVSTHHPEAYASQAKFRCPVERCDYRAKAHDTLRAHIRRIHGQEVLDEAFIWLKNQCRAIAVARKLEKLALPRTAEAGKEGQQQQLVEVMRERDQDSTVSSSAQQQVEQLEENKEQVELEHEREASPGKAECTELKEQTVNEEQAGEKGSSDNEKREDVETEKEAEKAVEKMECRSIFDDIDEEEDEEQEREEGKEKQKEEAAPERDQENSSDYDVLDEEEEVEGSIESEKEEEELMADKPEEDEEFDEPVRSLMRERKVLCHVCGERFFSPEALKGHVKIIHDVIDKESDDDEEEEEGKMKLRRRSRKEGEPSTTRRGPPRAARLRHLVIRDEEKEEEREEAEEMAEKTEKKKRPLLPAKVAPKEEDRDLTPIRERGATSDEEEEEETGKKRRENVKKETKREAENSRRPIREARRRHLVVPEEEEKGGKRKRFITWAEEEGNESDESDDGRSTFSAASGVLRHSQLSHPTKKAQTAASEPQFPCVVHGCHFSSHSAVILGEHVESAHDALSPSMQQTVRRIAFGDGERCDVIICRRFSAKDANSLSEHILKEHGDRTGDFMTCGCGERCRSLVQMTVHWTMSPECEQKIEFCCVEGITPRLSPSLVPTNQPPPSLEGMNCGGNGALEGGEMRGSDEGGGQLSQRQLPPRLASADAVGETASHAMAASIRRYNSWQPLTVKPQS